MLSATKVRIYPTEEQQNKLAQQFGCVRWVYNEALRIKSAAWKERQESISCYSLKSQLPIWKQEHPWLKEADSQALQEAIRNLDRAYLNFFEGRAKYPRFKNRYHEQSLAYPQRVKLQDDLLYLPKVGWVAAVIHRPVEGQIKTVTVSKSKTGKYYASLLTKQPEADPPKPLSSIDAHQVTGIDLGLTHIAITSDGKKIPNPRFLKNASANVRRKQKALSRKQKGSANRAKARRNVASAHERLTNARHDFQHRLSYHWVDENQAIIVETLRVKNMLKNRKLSKHIQDAAWGGLVRKVEYKAQQSGKITVKLDQWFPSSKTCSGCGHKLTELSLDIRYWTCPACGQEHDRDINAAINIREQGLLQLKADGLSVSACRRLGQSSVLEAPADEAGNSGSDVRSLVLQGEE